MKKTLLSIFTILGLAATSQTLTEANHAPTSGDTFGTYQCDSVSPGASGTGAMWDFSAMTIHTSIVKDYISAVSANTSFPNAYLAVASATNNVSYYSSSPSFLKYYGGNLSINNFEFNINYSSPAVYASYPMSLNSATSSATAGSVTVTSPTALSGTFTGVCNVNIDGKGTLMLPSRTLTNVLRVVTSQNINANVGVAVTVNLVNYEFFESAQSKFPLITVSTSTLNSLLGSSTQTITTILKNHIVVGVNESNAEVTDLSVYPNPATSLINFTTASNDAAKVIVLDITGKVIANDVFEMGNAKLNTNTLAEGVYIYKIIDKNSTILKTGKFSVIK